MPFNPSFGWDYTWPVAKTAAYTIPAEHNGCVYTNTGATSIVIFTLPPAVVGLSFTIVRTEVAAAKDVRAEPDGTDQIMGTDTAGDY